jgi:3-deoxy-D-manno-octulosonic-acid transferase
MITGESITVAELIRDLKECSPSAEVVVAGIDSAGKNHAARN